MIDQQKRAELRRVAQQLIDVNERSEDDAAVLDAEDDYENEADPSTILALLDALDAVERERDEAREALPRRWIVVNIGCIECGVSSDIVGTYATEAEAQAVAAACEKKLEWRGGGQNSFDVFDLHAPQADEYRAALQPKESER